MINSYVGKRWEVYRQRTTCKCGAQTTPDSRDPGIRWCLGCGGVHGKPTVRPHAWDPEPFGNERVIDGWEAEIASYVPLTAA